VRPWRWEQPQTFVIRWTGKGDEAIAPYRVSLRGELLGDRVAGIDLGEVHPAVVCAKEAVRLQPQRSVTTPCTVWPGMLSCLSEVHERMPARRVHALVVVVPVNDGETLRSSLAWCMF